MDVDIFAHAVPLWVSLPLTMLVIVLAMGLGRRCDFGREAATDGEGSALVGAVIPAMLAMVAFMLALTFSLALNRFDARKQLLVDEVNRIGTAYLRAGMLAQTEGLELRQLLRDYVDLRVQVIRQPDPDNIAVFLLESVSQHEAMWSLIRQLMRADPYSQANALFVTALNEVIDVHTERVVVGQYTIPLVIWIGLYGITLLSFATLGYQSKQSGSLPRALQWTSAATFSLVILLIQDLDRNNEGWLRLNHQPTIELGQWMHASTWEGA